MKSCRNYKQLYIVGLIYVLFGIIMWSMREQLKCFGIACLTHHPHCLIVDGGEDMFHFDFM